MRARGAPGGPGDRIAKPERLLNLVAFLLSSSLPVPFSRIKGRVAGYDDDASPEALEKRFDRDKAELRGLGVPIVYEQATDATEEGYRIPREQYFLPELHLDLEEAAALAVVQRYAQTAADDPLAASLQSALRKILVDSPISTAAMASVTEQHRLGVRTKKRSPEIAANLESLTDAVVRRRSTTFRYYSIERDSVAQRSVNPYGLGWHGGNWYLVGFDHDRDDVRQFRVDRIKGRVKVRAGRAFDVPDDFDVDAHVGRPAYSFRGDGETFRTEIALAPEIAFMVRDAPRPDWKLVEHEDGSAVLSFDARDGDSVIRFAAQHAERARVEAPPEIRERARAHFAAILANHEGEPTAAPSRRAKRKAGS